MLSICRSDCCDRCSRKEECGGCVKTQGRPFGGVCVAAGWIREKGWEGYLREKEALIREINALGIPHLQVEDLCLLNGFYVNMAYPLPNGETVRLLCDDHIYLGTQITLPDRDRCYGLAADGDYLLVCEYGPRGEDPRIILYQKRAVR